jgi:hypothetical protein
MRDLMDLLTEAESTGNRIDRSAFLYLPPKPPNAQFAQCASCVHFIPDDRCGIFSDKDQVQADASCGLYLHGKPNDQQCRDIVTPEQAGYVTGAVRCENCSWYEQRTCGLYKMLQQRLPDVFDLDIQVDPQGCCNAWQAGES